MNMGLESNSLEAAVSREEWASFFIKKCIGSSAREVEALMNSQHKFVSMETQKSSRTIGQGHGSCAV